MSDKPTKSDREVGFPGRPGPADDRRHSISDDRAAEIRFRIRNGDYEAPEVIDAVARAIAQSGDL